MAVASFQPPATVYREEQTFGWWHYAVAAFVEIVSWLTLFWAFQDGPHPGAAGHDRGVVSILLSVAGLALPVVVVIGLLKMTTEVTPTDLRVWFGWVPTYRRFIALAQVQRVEVVTYRPLLDYGGWGIRGGRDGTRALHASGNQGVRIDLIDGTRLLIGSQRPEVLALAIENAIRPVS